MTWVCRKLITVNLHAYYLLIEGIAYAFKLIYNYTMTSYNIKFIILLTYRNKFFRNQTTMCTVIDDNRGQIIYSRFRYNIAFDIHYNHNKYLTLWAQSAKIYLLLNVMFLNHFLWKEILFFKVHSFIIFVLIYFFQIQLEILNTK